MGVTQSDKPIVRMSDLGDIFTAMVPINAIRWVSKAATAGDDLLVVDTDGDIILEAVADGLNFDREYLIGGRWENPEIATIDSGAIYINRYVSQIPLGVPIYGAWAYK